MARGDRSGVKAPGPVDLEGCVAELERLQAQNRDLRERLQMLRLGRRVLLTLLAREATRRAHDEVRPGRRPKGAPASRAGVRPGDGTGSIRIGPWPMGDPDPAGQG